jgi:hypothetical protein
MRQLLVERRHKDHECAVRDLIGDAGVIEQVQVERG